MIRIATTLHSKVVSVCPGVRGATKSRRCCCGGAGSLAAVERPALLADSFLFLALALWVGSVLLAVSVLVGAAGVDFGSRAAAGSSSVAGVSVSVLVSAGWTKRPATSLMAIR